MNPNSNNQYIIKLILVKIYLPNIYDSNFELKTVLAGLDEHWWVTDTKVGEGFKISISS